MTKAMVMMPVDAVGTDSSKAQRRENTNDSQRKVDFMMLVMTTCDSLFLGWSICVDDFFHLFMQKFACSLMY